LFHPALLAGLNLFLEVILVPQTVYLQPGDDAGIFLTSGFCERCLVPAAEWAKKDRHGGVEVYGDYDNRANLVGFLCPECAGGRRTLTN